MITDLLVSHLPLPSDQVSPLEGEGHLKKNSRLEPLSLFGRSVRLDWNSFDWWIAQPTQSNTINSLQYCFFYIYLKFTHKTSINYSICKRKRYLSLVLASAPRPPLVSSLCVGVVLSLRKASFLFFLVLFFRHHQANHHHSSTLKRSYYTAPKVESIGKSVLTASEGRRDVTVSFENPQLDVYGPELEFDCGQGPSDHPRFKSGGNRPSPSWAIGIFRF